MTKLFRDPFMENLIDFRKEFDQIFHSGSEARRRLMRLLFPQSAKSRFCSGLFARPS